MSVTIDKFSLTRLKFEITWPESQNCDTTCWWIWRWRNDEVFQRDQIQENKKAFIYSQAQVFEDAWRNIMNDHVTPKHMRNEGYRWCPPLPGWFKHNTNGPSKGNSCHAGGGGVIRDASGKWKAGFIQVTGICDAITSETSAIRRGLHIARSIGVSNLVVECDSQTMVRYMTEGIAKENSLFTLVNSCKELVCLLEKVKVVFCYQECNKLADHLANLALDVPGGSQVLVDLPESCVTLLAADACSAYETVIS